MTDATTKREPVAHSDTHSDTHSGTHPGGTPGRPTRFRRSHRVVRRRDFDRAFQAARPAHGRLFAVRCFRRPEDEAQGSANPSGTRLGLVVGKRCGNAPVRNRIKRRIREVFRAHQHELPPHTDVIVAAKSGDAARCPYGELRDELLRLVRQNRRKRKSRGSSHGGTR